MTTDLRALARKLYRYSVASIAGTIIGTGSLALFTAVFGWPAELSNVLSVTLGTIPNYLINRYWTWQRAGRERMATESAVFWVLALLGLLISTVCVSYAERRWDTTLALVAAQLAGFGVLWVGKFLFLEKVLFKAVEAVEHHEHPEGAPVPPQ